MQLKALEAGIESGTLASALAKLTDKVEPGKGRSEEAQARTRFAKADAPERLELLLTDETVRQEILGGEQAAQLAQIKLPEVAELAKSLQQAQREDILARDVESLRKFPAGQTALREHELAVSTQQRELQEEKHALGREQERAEAREGMRRITDPGLDRFVQRSGQEVHFFLDDAAEFTGLRKQIRGDAKRIEEFGEFISGQSSESLEPRPLDSNPFTGQRNVVHPAPPIPDVRASHGPRDGKTEVNDPAAVDELKRLNANMERLVNQVETSRRAGAADAARSRHTE